MERSKDIKATIRVVEEASADHYFGEILIMFRAGVVQYVRKNELKKIDEIIAEQNSIDKIK